MSKYKNNVIFLKLCNNMPQDLEYTMLSGASEISEYRVYSIVLRGIEGKDGKQVCLLEIMHKLGIKCFPTYKDLTSRNYL